MRILGTHFASSPYTHSRESSENIKIIIGVRGKANRDLRTPRSFADSAHAAFETHAEQFLGFDGELHGEFLEHVLGVAVDDEADSTLGRDATLLTVEELFLGYLAGCGFVFENGIRVVSFNIWPNVGSTPR